RAPTRGAAPFGFGCLAWLAWVAPGAAFRAMAPAQARKQLRLGQRARQLDIEHALAEVAMPVESPLAADAPEAPGARALDHGPGAGALVLVGAGGAGHVVADEGEAVAIGGGQRLIVVIRHATGARDGRVRKDD